MSLPGRLPTDGPLHNRRHSYEMRADYRRTDIIDSNPIIVEGSPDAEKRCQRAIHFDQCVWMQIADGRANLVVGYRLRLVDHDLGFLTQPIVGSRFNRNSQQGCRS